MTEPHLAYPENVLPRLRYQFCPMCTTPLERSVIHEDGIARVRCPACGWVHYPTNVVGACTIVEHGQGIVAILPASSPPDMPAAFPAGHCEYGESPEQAAVREALEETGLVVELTRSLGWYFNPQPSYPGPNVTFFFVARSVGGELRGSAEGPAAVFPRARFPKISPTRRGSTRAWQLYLASLADQGRLRPVIEAVYPLAEARRAFEHSLRPHGPGKIVIQISE